MLIATNMVIIGFDPSPGLVEFTDLLFQCPISNWITGVPIVSSFARWCHGTMAAVQVGDEDIPGSFQCDIWCLFHHPNITTNGSIYFHIFHSKNKKIQKDRNSSTCRSLVNSSQILVDDIPQQAVPGPLLQCPAKLWQDAGHRARSLRPHGSGGERTAEKTWENPGQWWVFVAWRHMRRQTMLEI